MSISELKWIWLSSDEDHPQQNLVPLKDQHNRLIIASGEDSPLEEKNEQALLLS